LIKTVVRHPKDPVALYWLGIIAFEAGDIEEAAEYLKRAVEARPSAILAHAALGDVHGKCADTDAAIVSYRHALETGDKPSISVAAAHGTTLIDIGTAAALDRIGAVRLAKVHQGLSRILVENGDIDHALSHYRMSAQLAPINTDALRRIGHIALQVGRVALQAGEVKQAVTLIEQSIDFIPTDFKAHETLGTAWYKLGDSTKAIASFRRAIKLALHPCAMATGDADGTQGDPHHLHPIAALGQTYKMLADALVDHGQLEAAIVAFRGAIAISPSLEWAHNNLGAALVRYNRFDEAVFAYEAALKLFPTCAETHENLGYALKSLGRSEAAIQSYRRAIDLNPGSGAALCQLFELMQINCDWRDREHIGALIDRMTDAAIGAGTAPPESAFMSLTRTQDASRNLAVATAQSTPFTRLAAQQGGPFVFGDRCNSDRRLRIGYLSGDFYNHPASHLMLGLFSKHNRDHFEIFVYSHGPDDDSGYRRKISQDCDKFVDLQTIGDRAAAEAIYGDRIDILIDRTGATANHRLGISAQRPAPIQVSYLGFAGTSGSDFMDYLIADRIVIPSGDERYFTEEIVYLPHTYQVTDNRQAIADRTFTRAAEGLPDRGFVYSAFNRPQKIEPLAFDSWMRILKSVPGSVLWLLGDPKPVRQNLHGEAEARGVAADRLVFADWLPKPDHLARMRLADLALDTFTYGGHTTTSDALWAGVPVIALTGNHFASRVSTSLLTAVGLPELATRSLADYEAMAIELAENPEKLVLLRRRLQDKRLSEPLFDTARFARNLDKALSRMWEIHQRGESPASFEIDDDAPAESVAVPN
jgi:predicted O-linked N-acetylglucosamine transferase (SPINDLY family)